MHGPAWLILAFFSILAIGGTASIDIVETGSGIKGDEATYVAMALSLARDGDLAFERRDLERFFETYRSGPEGIFLKPGYDLALGRCGERQWPCLVSTQLPDQSRLYFGKSFAHAVAATPFVWLFGLNGLLVLNVVLLATVALAGYHFAALTTSPPVALAYVLAFLGATVVPLYVVWLTPEIFNVATVFLAYWCWLYPVARERAGRPPLRESAGRWLEPALTIGAALLLGAATFSKPSHLLLAAPPVLYALGRRRWREAIVFSCAFAFTVAAGFGINALVTGEFNYQGGAARKTFYGKFPFETPDSTFEALGISVTTNAPVVDLVREREVMVPRFLANASYFLVGRHTGLAPYFFPAVVLLFCLLREFRLRPAWHWLVAGAVGATALVLLLMLPFTWAGGGGPPGNRYFLGVYPALFFLLPVRLGWLVPAVMTFGGALVAAPLLANPFLSSTRPWMAVERGPARILPVELTMVNDLPIMINPNRSRIPYGDDPRLFLYLLDESAWPPEKDGGMWIAGRARADLIVRTGDELGALRVEVYSPVAQQVRLEGGGRVQRLDLPAGARSTAVVPVHGQYAQGGHSYLLSITTEDGVVPRLTDPASRDGRLLGARIWLHGIRASRSDAN
ncbi:MAG TPA: hypothetical protein VIL35_08035 [Vicinamibacterales bacterium]